MKDEKDEEDSTVGEGSESADGSAQGVKVGSAGKKKSPAMTLAAHQALTERLLQGQFPGTGSEEFAKLRASLKTHGIVSGIDAGILQGIAANLGIKKQMSIAASEAIGRVSQQLKDTLRASSGLPIGLDISKTMGLYTGLLEGNRRTFDGLLSGLSSQEVRVRLDRALGPTILDNAFQDSLQTVLQAVSDFSNSISLQGYLPMTASQSWVRAVEDMRQSLTPVTEALLQANLDVIAEKHPVLAEVMEYASEEVEQQGPDGAEIHSALKSLEDSHKSGQQESRLYFLLNVLLTIALWANPLGGSSPGSQVNVDMVVVEVLNQLAKRGYELGLERQLLHDAPLRIEPSGRAKEQCRLEAGSTVLVLDQEGHWYQVEVQAGVDGEGVIKGWLYRRHLTR